MRWLRRIFAIVVLLVLLGAGGLGALWYLSAFQGFSDQVFVEIERGVPTRHLAEELEEKGVVRSKWAFLFVRALNPRARLQAGEYRFDAASTPFQVFDKIRRGEVYYEEFTVPEGSNLFDISTLLAKLNMLDSAEFLKVARTPDLIKDLDPLAPNLEGFLFPSTYRLTRKTTAKQL